MNTLTHIKSKNHSLIITTSLMFLVVSSTVPFLFMVPEAGPVRAAPSVISTISGFNGPFDVAHDPVNGRMYVTNFNGDNILVVDTDTNTIIGSPIPAGDDGPRRITYDAEHQRMYVTNSGNTATSISVINTASNPPTLLTNIPIGGRSDGIAYYPIPGNEKMYVVDMDGAPSVTIIDTDTNTVAGTVSLPSGFSPAAIAYDPDDQRMYVTRVGFPGSLDIIDTTTNTLDTVHGPVTIGDVPQFGIAYDPVHDDMYVSNSASGSVSIIDTTATPNTVSTTLNMIGGSPDGIAYDQVNGRMYVVAGFGGPSNVRVIDTSTIPPSLTSSPIPVGIQPFGIAYDPEHGRMYVANSIDNTVSVIQITTATTTITSAVDGNGSPVTNGGSTSSNAITFTFSGTATAPTTVNGFECRLDNAAFAPCTSPAVFNNLAGGSHTFQVRAVDESGNRQVPSTSFSWQIVVTPPIPTPPPDSSCIIPGPTNIPIIGTNGPDTLIGNNGNNLMDGLGGNDRMNGCGGNDSVNGNVGNDGITGGSGNDAVSGGDGDDNVQGGSGNDIVSGNAGTNTLTGGSGNDMFVCGPSGGDRITDFQPGQDLRLGNCILGPAQTPASTPIPPTAPSNSNSIPTPQTLISIPLP